MAEIQPLLVVPEDDAGRSQARGGEILCIPTFCESDGFTSVIARVMDGGDPVTHGCAGERQPRRVQAVTIVLIFSLTHVAKHCTFSVYCAIAWK